MTGKLDVCRAIFPARELLLFSPESTTICFAKTLYSDAFLRAAA
jgi:hypothetical protein